jgi:hypothetical protein
MDAKTDRLEKTTKAITDQVKPFAAQAYALEEQIEKRKGGENVDGSIKALNAANKFAKIMQYGNLLVGMGSLDVGNKGTMGAVKTALKSAGFKKPVARRLAENCKNAIYGNMQIEGLQAFLREAKRTPEQVVGWLKSSHQITNEAQFKGQITKPTDPVSRLIKTLENPNTWDEQDLERLRSRIGEVFENRLGE